VNRDFWRGRRVFLTGHTGFKGAWLSLMLQHMGARVTGFAMAPPTTPSLFEAAGVAQGMESREGDIRDRASIAEAMKRAEPEVVIHMAAQALVRRSYADPVETYATNVMGTVHVLDAMREAPSVRSAVMVTSDKCYENREWVWGYRENEAMGGYDPYSNSKGCAELVTSAYRNSFFNPGRHAEHGVGLATARAGNVIGGGDWAQDRLVPDILRSFGNGDRVTIRSPHAVRPWQHVLEPLSGYLLLAERLFEEGPSYAGGWNFGPVAEDARPVKAIVETMATYWGKGAAWQLDANPQPHEAHFLRLDISKAAAALGWRPRWSLDTALEKIVDWHRAWLVAPASARTQTIEQIDQFEHSEA
jgi:CDP-glucose 4,6-dehydratase